MIFTPRRPGSRAACATVRTGLTAGLAVVLVTGAAAPAAAAAPSLGQRAVTEAARHRGAPYEYGAAGPTRFDCSGLTQYVYGRLGRRLPRTTDQQYAALAHVARGNQAPGDLLFMQGSGGSLTHVGIYAGNNQWWVAPKTGDVVKLQTLYSTGYVVGRVG